MQPEMGHNCSLEPHTDLVDTRKTPWSHLHAQQIPGEW